MFHRGLPQRFRTAFRLALRKPDVVASEIDDEIAFHLQERIDALVGRGWSLDAAELEARRRFGDLTTVRPALFAAAHRRERRLGALEWIDAVRVDLKIAARQLRRAPNFAFGTVAAFALGIGANATMFGVIDRLLLRPPAQIASPSDVYTMPSRPTPAISYPTFVNLRAHLSSVASIAAESFHWPLSIGHGDESQLAQTVFVDGAYFRTLDVRPAVGRMLSDDDVRLPNGQRVAVIGFGLWQQRFASDRAVIGRELIVGSVRVRIVGVAPEGFNGVGTRPLDLWLPLTLASGLLPGVAPQWANGGGNWLSPIARVAPAVDPRQIASRATALRRAENAARGNADTTVAVELHSILPSRADAFSPEVKVASLLGAVSLLVLLIACSNAANLMLARAIRRRREIGIRIALGVSRGRLIAQFLAESMVLSTLGGIAAFFVTAAGSALMRRVLLEGFAWSGGLIDARTAGFIACAAVVAGLLTGLAPAVFLLRRFDVSRAIGEGHQLGGVHRHRAISSLVVTQTVLSVMLLIGALLFVRSLRKVRGVPLGVDLDHTLVVSLDPQTLNASSARADALFAELRERVAAVHGVTNAAVAEGVAWDWHMGTRISVPGRSLDLPAIVGTHYMSAVTDTYFSTIETRIIQGRAFTNADDRATREGIAIVSNGFAKAVWPDGDAVGQCVRLGTDSMPCLRIVGVAEDIHESAVDGNVPDAYATDVYVPLSQGRHAIRARVVIAHVAAPMAGVIAGVRSAVRSVDPSMPFANIWMMESRLEPELRPWRLGATMFSVFGGLALVLAALGLYSVIGYSVAQRTGEMGIRIALGAQRSDILALVGWQGATLAGIGIGIATAAAAVLAPLVQPLLFQTSARSVAIYAFVGGTMLLIALGASLVPAARAAAVDPMSVIRSE
jgi:predicted permease